MFYMCFTALFSCVVHNEREHGDEVYLTVIKVTMVGVFLVISWELKQNKLSYIMHHIGAIMCSIGGAISFSIQQQWSIISTSHFMIT
eukprot:UN05536